MLVARTVDHQLRDAKLFQSAHRVISNAAYLAAVSTIAYRVFGMLGGATIPVCLAMAANDVLPLAGSYLSTLALTVIGRSHANKAEYWKLEASNLTSQ